MPFKDPDPTDPNMLVGVMLPADAEATRDMAYAFAEEFARLGYSREQLLWLFKNPFYGGAHGAYRMLGENETLAIIDECLNVWGNLKIKIQDAQDDQDVQMESDDSKPTASKLPPLRSPGKRKDWIERSVHQAAGPSLRGLRRPLLGKSEFQPVVPSSAKRGARDAGEDEGGGLNGWNARRKER